MYIPDMNLFTLVILNSNLMYVRESEEPDCMKICFKALYNTSEIGKEIETGSLVANKFYPICTKWYIYLIL